MTSSEPNAQMSPQSADPGGLLDDLFGGVVDDAVSTWSPVVDGVAGIAADLDPFSSDIDMSTSSVDFGTSESGVLPGEWESADYAPAGLDSDLVDAASDFSCFDVPEDTGPCNFFGDDV